VRMTHLPTGIVVSMQNEKSQLQNRAAGLRGVPARPVLNPTAVIVRRPRPTSSSLTNEEMR